MLRLVLAAALFAVGAAQAAPPRLTEAAVQAFVARQEAAWNRKDAAGFAATFAPDAVFIDQARDSHGGITQNGRSTLAQAVAQARRYFAKHRFTEVSVVDRVVIAPDGRAAQVFGHETARVETPGQAPRTLCAETAETVVLVGGRLVSRGQTDTDVRCPH